MTLMKKRQQKSKETNQRPQAGFRKAVSPTGGQSSRVRTPELLRGFKDITHKDAPFWVALFRRTDAIASAYNFVYTDTPILEEASLFVRSIGRGTDVVDKEMYMFEDKDGAKVALRPEATAGIARAYITHGMHTLPQPVKLWYMGPMFRHDRPQAGRFREFHQFGAETLGVRDAAVDAELVSMAYHFLADMGIDVIVKINSIGTLEEREQYVMELTSFLRSKRSYLSELSKQRIAKNPLRVLDSKEEQDRQVVAEAPQMIDWLGENSKKFFMKVLEYLDAMEIPYELEPTLVRGLDYYSDTVFELFENKKEDSKIEEGAQSALGGGGRYDRLIEILGGPSTPACGFALGLERVISVLRRLHSEGVFTPHDRRLNIFFAQLGEQARMRALKLMEDLRKEGIVLHHSFGKSALKAQLEQAHKIGASHTLILGQREVQDGTIILRDMESGIQEMVDQQKLAREIRRIAKEYEGADWGQVQKSRIKQSKAES